MQKRPTFGKYKVSIESFKFVGEGDSQDKKQLLPDQYNKFTILELTVDKAKMEEQNFDLKAE